MTLFNPAHPGALIRETLEGLFEETGQKLTVAEVATGLGTTRKTLSAIINGRQSVTPEMAIRLGAAFANTTPEFWLTVQENYDLAQARRNVDTSNVKVFWPLTGRAIHPTSRPLSNKNLYAVKLE